MPTETKSRKGIGGPNTKEGKEQIRLNALRMGLHSNTLEGMQAVSDVIGVEFEVIHEEMRGYHRPKDAMEDALVHRIARCIWKLRVIETMEDYLFRGMMVKNAPGASLEGLSVIERRTDTQLHRNIQALATKRKQDREKMKNELADLPPPGKWPRPAPDFEDSESQTPQDSQQPHEPCSPAEPPTSKPTHQFPNPRIQNSEPAAESRANAPLQEVSRISASPPS